MSPAWDLLVASLHVYLDKRRNPEVPVSRAALGLPLQPTDGSWSWAWAGAMAAAVRGGDTCGMEGRRSTDVFAELRSAGENEGMAGTPRESSREQRTRAFPAFADSIRRRRPGLETQAQRLWVAPSRAGLPRHVRNVKAPSSDTQRMEGESRLRRAAESLGVWGGHGGGKSGGGGRMEEESRGGV